MTTRLTDVREAIDALAGGRLPLAYTPLAYTIDAIDPNRGAAPAVPGLGRSTPARGNAPPGQGQWGRRRMAGNPGCPVRYLR